MLKRLTKRMQHSRQASAAESLRLREEDARPALKAFLEGVAKALPDFVDPTITEIDIDYLGSGQLMEIHHAAGRIATQMIYLDPLKALVEARRRAEYYDAIAEQPPIAEAFPA